MTTVAELKRRLGLAVGALVALTLLGLLLAWSDARLRRLWLGLLATELLQGVIGYVQYFTNLPEALVIAHMLGATLLVVALTNGILALRRR